MDLQIKTLSIEDANIKEFTDLAMSSVEEVRDWDEFFNLIKSTINFRNIDFKKSEPIVVELKVNRQIEKIFMF